MESFAELELDEVYGERISLPQINKPNYTVDGERRCQMTWT